MNYVIIGNSTAAVGAVEGIRQVDRDGKITIVGKEPYHTYSRPLISYLLCGKTDERRMKYRKDDFYETMRCHALLGKTAVKIDPERRLAMLDDGTAIGYDRLLVATGSEPLVPPVPGLENVKRRTAFMSLDDAKKLKEMLSPEARVLIIGAGLIGLKCAEGISGKVAGITVVDLAPVILSSILDEQSAGIVQSRLEEHGIEFMLGTAVANMEGNTAFLRDGRQVSFDVLVIAAGVRPNTGLVKDIGGEVGKGIAANEFMQTSIPDIYAAGDCCESFDITTGSRRVLALLPNAYMQGECAGINMAGGRKEFGKAIPMNAISLFGLRIVTAGSYDGEATVLQEGGTYKKFFTKDGLLKGYILIGTSEKAGIYTSLVRERTPLENLDFGLICRKPGLMAFSRAERIKKLGGA